MYSLGCALRAVSARRFNVVKLSSASAVRAIILPLSKVTSTVIDIRLQTKLSDEGRKPRYLTNRYVNDASSAVLRVFVPVEMPRYTIEPIFLLVARNRSSCKPSKQILCGSTLPTLRLAATHALCSLCKRCTKPQPARSAEIYKATHSCYRRRHHRHHRRLHDHQRLLERCSELLPGELLPGHRDDDDEDEPARNVLRPIMSRLP